MLDERAKTLLKTLVERYIADGQPVGSRTLSRASGLELSPATIRNVMADLEELGLIVSPHTSAGRVPTARGYRMFVDTMLTVRSTDAEAQLSQLLAGTIGHGEVGDRDRSGDLVFVEARKTSSKRGARYPIESRQQKRPAYLEIDQKVSNVRKGHQK